MSNPMVKTFGIASSIVIVVALFAVKEICGVEIVAIYENIKDIIIDWINHEPGEEYEILVEKSMRLANEHRHNEAIECYMSAIELLNEEDDKIEMAKCYNQIGMLYLSVSDIIQAIQYLDQSKELSEDIEITADNYIDLCDIYINVAIGRIQYNEFDEALQIYYRVINIYDDMNNVNSEERALIYDKFAGLYYKLGDIPNAISYVEKAREMIEDTSGNANINTAIIYETVCLVYSDVDYEYAKKYGEKAYQIMKNNGGKNPEMIAVCHALSYLYSNTDKEKSYDYARKRYENNKLLYGEMYIDTILSQVALADYENNGRKVVVLEELKKKVIANYGENSIETAIIWSNLANAYMSIYNETEAQKIYFECLHIYEELLGPEHPYVASVYYNLALLAKNTGEYSLQIKYAETAQEIYRNRYGEMYFEVAGLYLILGDAEYVYSGDYNKSLRLYEKAKNIYISLYGEWNALVAECDEKRARIYIVQHDLITAEELIHSCIEIYENEYGSMSDKMGEALLAQSEINLYSKKIDLAIMNANRVMDICKIYGRENSPFAETVYYILSICYCEKKDWEKVSYYAQKSIDLIEMNYPYLRIQPEYTGSCGLLALSYSMNVDCYDLAVDAINRALEASQLCNNGNIKVQAYYDAARVYSNLGEKDMALNYINNAYLLASEIDEFHPNLEAIAYMKKKILAE